MTSATTVLPPAHDAVPETSREAGNHRLRNSPHATLLAVAFWSAIAVMAFLSAFMIQFLFPLREAVYSPAYTIGGNNRVGAVLVACVGCLTTLACLRWKFGALSRAAVAGGTTLPRRYFYYGSAAVVTVVIVLGALMTRGGYYHGDAGYWATQLRSGMIFHYRLYKDLEFAYGPFLYFWPAAFVKVLSVVGLNMDRSYVVSLVVMEILGTGMVFYTVNALPLSRRMKIAAFAFFIIVTLDPQEGLNYNAFRFMLPACGLVLLCRQRTPWRTSVFAALCAAFEFAVSPELGIAFTAAAVVWTLYRMFVMGRRWAPVAFAAVGGAGAFLLLEGSAYLHTLREFAKGGYNMILEPAPHIYLLILCAVALAPMAVADSLRLELSRRKTALGYSQDTGMQLALYIAGLALLPAALGRCDPLHVSFNGWSLYLLTFLTLDRVSRRWQTFGISIAILFGVYSVTQECALGFGSLRELFTQGPDVYENADLPHLQQRIGSGRVAFPWNKPLRLTDQLIAAGEYQPMYLCIPAVDAEADARTVEDMRKADFVALPIGLPVITENPINNVGIKYRFRFGFVYEHKNPPFRQGWAAMQELKSNWHSIGEYGWYVIFAKNTAASPMGKPLPAVVQRRDEMLFVK